MLYGKGTYRITTSGLFSDAATVIQSTLTSAVSRRMARRMEEATIEDTRPRQNAGDDDQ
jgi:hypothetical protein